MIHRVPEDLDAERTLLASCCAPGAQDLALEASLALTEEDFMAPQHAAIFRAMCALVKTGTEIHAITLKAQLEEAKELHKVGGYPSLVEILMHEDMGSVRSLIEILSRKSAYRKLVKIGGELSRKAALEDGDPSELMGTASEGLLLVARSGAQTGLKGVSRVSDGCLQRIRDIQVGKAVPGASTGLSQLDSYLGGGLKPGQLIILAARPGVGKTALALQIALYMAATDPVAFFTLEMSQEELWGRMISHRGRVPSQKLAVGDLDPAAWERVHRADNYLRSIPLLIDDTADTNPIQIRSEIDKAIIKHGQLALGTVDYLQLLNNAKDSRASKQNEAVRVAELSRQLKLIAKGRRIPMLVLSQLSRESVKTNRRPDLHDLRDSGAIEQDADVVMFLHRADPDTELIIAKNRNGPTGTIYLETNLENFEFKERVGFTSKVETKRNLL